MLPLSLSDSVVPDPLRAGLRGVGQVFFQENAWTGACFVLGIVVSSPAMAIGAVVGTAIGTATAWALKFDKSELTAGIYGFNSTLVGIATLFFFRPGVVSIGLLVVGCVVAAIMTWLMRRYVPFPTYTGAVYRHDVGRCFSWGWPWVRRGSSRDHRWAVSASSGPCASWRQPGDVPGELLDGPPVSCRHRLERLAARVVGAGGLDHRHAGRATTIDGWAGLASTQRALSIAACLRMLRWGYMATMRHWRPSPCFSGGGR